MILHGLSKDDVASYENNTKFQVQRFPANFKTWLMVNQNKGIFKDQALRTALQSAINKQQIVEPGLRFGRHRLHPVLSAGRAARGHGDGQSEVRPGAAGQGRVAGSPNKKVDLAYSSDDARNQRDAEIIQTELQSAGLNATVRGIPIAQVFDLPNHKDQAPDLLLSTVNPDASHPDTWARIFTNTAREASTGCSARCPPPTRRWTSDSHATTTADVQAHYAKAADLQVANGCFDTIADVKDVVVASRRLQQLVPPAAEPVHRQVRAAEAERLVISPTKAGRASRPGPAPGGMPAPRPFSPGCRARARSRPHVPETRLPGQPPTLRHMSVAATERVRTVKEAGDPGSLVVDVADLHVTFQRGGQAVRAVRGVDLEIEPGRDPRSGRGVRLGQERPRPLPARPAPRPTRRRRSTARPLVCGLDMVAAIGRANAGCCAGATSERCSRTR